MAIEGLRKYQRRDSRGMFAHLPPEARPKARQWLDHLCRRRRARGLPLTPQVFAILCGRAARLSRMSKEDRSAWWRSMLAKRGGYAAQRKYRAEARNPTLKATSVRLAGTAKSGADGGNVAVRDSSAPVYAHALRRPFVRVQPPAPPGCQQWLVPGGRPDAPPMLVRIGRPPRPQDRQTTEPDGEPIT